MIYILTFRGEGQREEWLEQIARIDTLKEVISMTARAERINRIVGIVANGIVGILFGGLVLIWFVGDLFGW